MIAEPTVLKTARAACVSGRSVIWSERVCLLSSLTAKDLFVEVLNFWRLPCGLFWLPFFLVYFMLICLYSREYDDLSN